MGYLEGGADGIYGAQTGRAVAAFNKQNGIDGGESALPETQHLIFDGTAVASNENRTIPCLTSKAIFQYSADDSMEISFEVNGNGGSDKHIQSFELLVYFETTTGEMLPRYRLQRTKANPFASENQFTQILWLLHLPAVFPKCIVQSIKPNT